MKKFWIYMAVPMTILNGCQNQPVLTDTSKAAVAEETLETVNAPKPPMEKSVIKEADFSGPTVTIAKSKEA